MIFADLPKKINIDQMDEDEASFVRSFADE